MTEVHSVEGDTIVNLLASGLLENLNGSAVRFSPSISSVVCFVDNANN